MRHLTIFLFVRIGGDLRCLTFAFCKKQQNRQKRRTKTNFYWHT